MSTDALETEGRAAAIGAQRIAELIDTHFPHIHGDERTFFVEDVTARTARVRMRHHPHNVRPGGTVSGPAMFTLADIAIWVAIMGALGEDGLDAVTTHFNLNFLSKPEARDMVALVTLLRVGRRSAVAECLLYSDGVEAMVAHTVAGYAIPSSPVGKLLPSVG